MPSSTHPLPIHAVRRNVEKLSPELGRADQERLTGLFPLIQKNGQILLAEVLSAFYPNQERNAALTQLRQFRSRISQAASEIGLKFSLETDGKTRTPPGQRWCWFAGDDLAIEGVIEKMEAESEVGKARSNQDVIDPRPVIRYFISYAHNDEKQVLKLLKPLQHLFQGSAHYNFKGWRDKEILPGEKWREEIQRAMSECHFGLLCTSPAFFASKFIREEELPQFVLSDGSAPDPNRRAIPVALKPVPFDGKVNLKGLEKRQFFLHKDRAFSGFRDGAGQESFALELFKQICAVLERYPPPTKPPDGGRRHDRLLRERVESQFESCKMVPTEAAQVRLDKNEMESDGKDSSVERIDALAALDSWLRDSSSIQPYCALLGEIGIGKTTTCLAFTRRLLERREQDRNTPLPIYLDLRNLGDANEVSLELPEIIAKAMRGGWKDGQAPGSMSAEEVMRLVQQEGALAIFDGLDEVLVHLSPAAGQRFTRELFRLLPPHLIKIPKENARPGRLLIACRTHYFRTLREQKTHFTAEDRDGITKDHYRAFVLLPFTDAQIRDYLEKHLPGEDIDRVIATIKAVHNLPEMAQRPYTLQLIAEQLPAIERWKLEGRRVTGVLLYQNMVRSWLERDTGKHQLTPDHKQQLMEHFAAALWRSGRRTWSVNDVEQWLIDFLRDRPEIAAHYDGKDRELLKEDLRTATFLVREGEDQFRFAHTSLLEFFLANFMYRALLTSRPGDWALPKVSPETLGFLGQLLLDLTETEQQTALATLRGLRDVYHPQISHRLLDYALQAHRREYPTVSLAGADFTGADLLGLEIRGRENLPLFNLHGIQFSGAYLENARFSHVDLSDAQFDNTLLKRAELLDVRAENACFQAAHLEGALLRDVDLTHADFTGAKTDHTQWLRCRLDDAKELPVSSSVDFFALCDPAASNTLPPLNPQWALLNGHEGEIIACAWAPDGRTLASAGADGTLRLWDMIRGECIAMLSGHERVVWACAWSPDGRTIASAGEDGTLRLWDPARGECIAVLSGHERVVWACAWSPDGRILASTGEDGALRLWDPARGECVATFSGHKGPVNACAWSPDGRILASTGEDGTLRLWDVARGEYVATLSSHTGSVNACAWAPKGRFLALAGFDGKLRLWDVAHGECVAVLSGHVDGVNACVWSPDGRTLASAGDDGTLRLWDVARGECVAMLSGHENRVWACAWTPDGRSLVSVGWDRKLRLWDVAHGECVALLSGHVDGVNACVWSPDGRTIASVGEGGTLRLWEVARGACLTTLSSHTGSVNACAWSPDGRIIASVGEGGTLRLWEVAHRNCVATLRGHEGSVWACAWSADGRTLASAGVDGTLRLWDVARGECVATLSGHAGWVEACAWSPDSRILASAGDDSTLRLWDVGRGECVATLRGHKDRVRACTWSPDGRTLVSAGADGTLREWDALQGESTGRVFAALSRDGWATLDLKQNRLLHASGDAWRWLGLQAPNPITGWMTRWPAEVLGELPQ